MMPLRIGLHCAAKISTGKNPTGKIRPGKILAGAILLALTSAAAAQAPAVVQRGGGGAFNVLDQVEYDPRTQRINLVGHYDPAFAGPAIPYVQFLATLLDNPTPRFSLDPAPGALAAAMEEISKRVKTRTDWQQMFAEWGDWMDADDKITPVGRVFLRAFGVWPLPDFASGEDPWAKADRHQLLARIFATAGNARAAAILDAYGAVRRAGAAVKPEQLRDLFAAAELAANADSTAAAVNRGILSAQQGLAETHGAFFRKLDETFELNGATVKTFENSQRSGVAIPASIDAGLREFDRQFQTIYRSALLKLWETRHEIHIPLSEITPSLRDTAKATPRYVDLDPNSLLAKLMLESDVFLKYLGHMPELAEKIPAYRSEFMFNLDQPRSGSMRYWISIEEVAASRSSDGNVLALLGAAMRINARAIDPNTGDDLPDTGLGGYGLLLTSLYNDLARVFPQYFHALREAGKLSYAAQWLRARNPNLRLPRQGRIVWSGPADVSAVVILFTTPIEPRPGYQATGTAIEGGVDGGAPTPDANIAKDRGVKPASSQTGCSSVTTSPSTAFFGIGGGPAVTLTDCTSPPPRPSAITVNTKAKSPPAKAASPAQQPAAPRPSPIARPIPGPAISLPEPLGEAVEIQGTVPRMPAWSPPKLKPTPPPLHDAEPDPCKSRSGTAFFGIPANPTGVDLGCGTRKPLFTPPPSPVETAKQDRCEKLANDLGKHRNACKFFQLAADAYVRHTPASSNPSTARPSPQAANVPAAAPVGPSSTSYVRAEPGFVGPAPPSGSAVAGPISAGAVQIPASSPPMSPQPLAKPMPPLPPSLPSDPSCTPPPPNEFSSGSSVPDGYEVMSYAEMKRDLFPNKSEREIAAMFEPSSAFSNYHAAIYREKGTNKLVVSFQGTQPPSQDPADMAKFIIDMSRANALQSAGLPSAYYDNAKKIAAALAGSKYAQDHEVEFVGHSLGGGLASAAIMVTCGKGIANFHATIINSSGLHRETVPDGDFGRAAQCVESYIVEDEPLNFLQDHRREGFATVRAAAVTATFASGGASGSVTVPAALLATELEQSGAAPQSLNRDNATILKIVGPSGPAPYLIGRHSMVGAFRALDSKISQERWEQQADCPASGMPAKANAPKSPGELRGIIDRQVDWPTALRDLSRMGQLADAKGRLTADDLTKLERLDNLRAAYRAVAGLRDAAGNGRTLQDVLQISNLTMLKAAAIAAADIAPMASPLPAGAFPFVPDLTNSLAKRATSRQNASRFLAELDGLARLFDNGVPFEKVLQAP